MTEDQTDKNDLLVKRRRVGLAIVRTLGLLFSGAAVLLAFQRLPLAFPGSPSWGLVGGALGITAAFAAPRRARLAYWLFLVAGAAHLLDLVSGYVHALLFLASCMILGGLAAINEPVDLELLGDDS